MRHIKTFLAASVAVLASTSAFALTETFGHHSPLFRLTLDPGDSFRLGAFDTSLGTLTGVRLTLKSSGAEQFEITNPFRLDEPFKHLTGSSSVFLHGPSGDVTQLLTSIPLDGIVPSRATANRIAMTNKSSTAVIVSGADFAAFEHPGGGLLDFSFNGGPTAVSVRVGNSLSIFAFGIVEADTFLTYTYRPTGVAEPASVALLAFSIGSLALARRRRA